MCASSALSHAALFTCTTPYSMHVCRYRRHHHRNQYKIHFSMASKTRGTNVRHTRATVTAHLEFLYKWMPLRLVYTIAMIVCEETRR